MWDKNSKHYLQKVKVGTQETKGSNYRILPKNSQELAEKGYFHHSKNSYGKDYAAHKAYKVNYLVEDLKVYSLHWRIIHRLDQNQAQIWYLSQKKEGPFKMNVVCYFFISFFDAFCPSFNVAFGYSPLSLDDSWDKNFVLGYNLQSQPQHEGEISCLPFHGQTYILIFFFYTHPLENYNISSSQKKQNLQSESHYFHGQKNISNLYHNSPKQQNKIHLHIGDTFQSYKTYQYYHFAFNSYPCPISISEQAIQIILHLQNHVKIICCFRQRHPWLAIKKKLDHKLDNKYCRTSKQKSNAFFVNHYSSFFVSYFYEAVSQLYHENDFSIDLYDFLKNQSQNSSLSQMYFYLKLAAKRLCLWLFCQQHHYLINKAEKEGQRKT